MMTPLLAMARSSALDGAMVSTQGSYNNDYTKPLLFLSDGSYLSGSASTQRLQGNRWGTMNEAGNYPGQASAVAVYLLVPNPPFKTPVSADALIWGIMALLTLAMVLVPFIPGVRSQTKVPRVYRLIWREHYRNAS
jgi:hypothetical protein